MTGTPGTGKTTATERLAADVDVVHLNAVVESEGLTSGTDDARGSWIADLDAVAEWLDDRAAGRDHGDDGRGADRTEVVESHLSHLFDADRVVVLRCRPDELEGRLLARGESAGKAAENAEAEALDLLLSEAVERHGAERVYEVDTTDRDPDEVAAEIGSVIAGDREPSAGEVSFVDYLEGRDHVAPEELAPADVGDAGPPDRS